MEETELLLLFPARCAEKWFISLGFECMLGTPAGPISGLLVLITIVTDHKTQFFTHFPKKIKNSIY